VISGFERGVNEVCSLLGFLQRRLAVSCQRFGTKVGGGEILTAVLVKIQAIWAFSPCRLVSLPSYSGPTAPQIKALGSTETSVTLHQSTGRNFNNTCVRASWLTE